LVIPRLKLFIALTGVVLFVYPDIAVAGFGFKVSADCVYTLYRNSVTEENMRIHIATFDVNEQDEYNKGNCEIARALFQQQPGVKVKYWCEKGYYKK
jgi:hypothetical protein